MSVLAAAPLRVGVVVGTRPEAIKLAPLVLALRQTPNIVPMVVGTGQHRGLVAELLAGFGIGIQLDLDLAGGHLTDLAGRAVAALGEAIRQHHLGALIVQGDTTTALAGALAGFYERCPVIHLEAGLRSDDRTSPYPEEVNRRLITQLAELHLAPTTAAEERLLAEGVPATAVAHTGNTVVDALLTAARSGAPLTTPALATLPPAARLLLVTAHRRESWGEGIGHIAQAVTEIVAAHPDVVAVWPLHPNPAVRDTVLAVLADRPRIVTTAPLAYSELVGLLARATLVITDSGGIQEEAISLGKPTLITRDTTERTEGIEAGGSLLVGTDRALIAREAGMLLDDPAAYEAMVCRSLPFGDGFAAQRALVAIQAFLLERRKAGIWPCDAGRADPADRADPARLGHSTPPRLIGPVQW